ncbi:MFS transporter [Dermacoccaceae bacterium W4C1]
MSTRSWEALQDKDFRWLFIGRLISMSGHSMAPVALSFAVLHLTDSAAALGLVLAGRTIAMVVCLLIGGVVSDRFSRRSVLMASHSLTAVTQGIVAWLILSGNATVTSILIIEVINGAASAFTLPALQGLVPQLVPPRLLQQANALMSFAQRGTMILGPAIAGLVVVGPGPGWALAVDAVCFAGAALALSRIRIPAQPARAASVLDDLVEGWQEFTARTWLWVIVVSAGLLNAIHAGAWLVLGPFIATSHPATLGETGWGLVLSAEAIGAVVMTLVLMRGNLRRPLLSGMLGVSLFALPLVVLGLAPTVWLLVPAAALAGLGMEVFGTGWGVAMMENVPQEAMSRVYSYDMLGSFIAIPIGSTVFGWLAAVSDAQTLAVGAGLAYAVIVGLTLAVPSVRGLGRVSEVSEHSAVRS